MNSRDAQQILWIYRAGTDRDEPQFAEALFGLAQLDAGEVLVDGKAVEIRSAADAVRLGIAYVPEDRRRHGVILRMPVAANTTLASLGSVGHCRRSATASGRTSCSAASASRGRRCRAPPWTAARAARSGTARW